MSPAYAIASLSSVLFGAADYSGGLAARHAPAPLVTCFSGIGALAVLFLGLPLLPGAPSGADLGWGAAAGACGALGASLMYRSLALGPMSLASPVFSLIGLAVPVLFGLTAGERPTALAWTGVGLAVLAIPLLSMTGEGPGHYPRAHVRRTLMVSIAAGLVIGWFLVFVARIGSGAGLWPLALARGVAIGLLAGWFLARRQSLVPPASVRPIALGGGSARFRRQRRVPAGRASRAARAGVGARLAGAGHHRAHRPGDPRRALDRGARCGAPRGAGSGRVHLGRMRRGAGRAVIQVRRGARRVPRAGGRGGGWIGRGRGPMWGRRGRGGSWERRP